MAHPGSPTSGQQGRISKEAEKVQKSCPFCQKQFMGLGNHLYRCKERQGIDYSIYLSQKTLAKKSGLPSHKACPHCHKQFRRLDTHLQFVSMLLPPPKRPPSAVQIMLNLPALQNISGVQPSTTLIHIPKDPCPSQKQRWNGMKPTPTLKGL